MKTKKFLMALITLIMVIGLWPIMANAQIIGPDYEIGDGFYVGDTYGLQCPNCNQMQIRPLSGTTHSFWVEKAVFDYKSTPGKMTVTLKFGWCDCGNNVNVYSNEVTQTIDFDCTKKLTELVQTNLKYTDSDGNSKNIYCYLYVCRDASGHKGGNATCITPAKCKICSLETGTVDADKHAGTVDKNGFYSCCSKPNTPENVNGVYQISNIGHLVWFRDYVNQGNRNANAILLNDLDMTGIAWTPIASTVLFYDANPTEESELGYKGIFDGNSKVKKILL